MSVIRWLSKRGVPDWRLLEFYPPFLFMGVRVLHVHSDYREMKARLPLRWYGKNLHGTMFGGFITAVADPWPALMCGKIFPGTEMWTKALAVDFLRPGASDLELTIRITDEDIAAIRAQLDSTGKATRAFDFDLVDDEGRAVARVRNTVALRATRGPRAPGE